jgi:trehalose/maltose transport system permease protein
LLSVRLTTVSCTLDSTTNQCKKTPSGLIVWDRSKIELQEIEKLRTLTAIQRESFSRYQAVDTIKMPGSNKGLRLLARDPMFIHSFFNTMHFTIVSVILETILGLIIALVVNSSFRGRGMMRAAMLVPWAIPTVISAVLWQTIMRPDQTGILNKLLIDLGIISSPQQWLGTTGPWMNAIITVDVWKTTPFMALLLLAGLQVIPSDLYEAASVDGAGKIRQFFSITLPLLRPAIAVALVFRTLDALRAFDVFQVLLDSTRPSMAYYNYDRLVSARLDGYASAVGVLIFVLIFIFTVLYVRFVGVERTT